MRNPAGTGFCWPMISRTLVTALAVRVTGAGFLATSGLIPLVTSGTVVVAIRISLALKFLDYSRCPLCRQTRFSYQSGGRTSIWLDANRARKSHPWRPITAMEPLSDSGIHPLLIRALVPLLIPPLIPPPRLANRAIIIALRASPGLVAGFLRLHHEVECHCTGLEICRGGL